MLRNMTVSLLRHEEITHHAAQGEGAAPRRRADDHARQEADASPTGASPSTACATATSSRKLFDDLGPRYAKRNGGYLRILKIGFRKGDNAPLALVSLMDRAERKRPPRREAVEEEERSQGRRGLIFTVGHGARSAAQLIAILKEAGIGTLVDVRAYPASRRHPQFSKQTWKPHCEKPVLSTSGKAKRSAACAGPTPITCRPRNSKPPPPR